jgi:transposase
MAMELSKKTWKLGFGVGGQKTREVNVRAGDLRGLSEAVSKAKKRFGLDPKAVVHGCYEAGRDGFWIHRALTETLSYDNVVVDPSSIEVNQRKRRAKSDRIDLKKLLRDLWRYHNGERDVWSVARVPTVEQEDDRRVHRELKRLTEERTGHGNRIQALLMTMGIQAKPTKGFAQALDTMTQYDGAALPPHLLGELKREYARYQLVEQQMKELRDTIKTRTKNADKPAERKAAELTTLVGIGSQGAWVLSHELFGWRTFNNRKEVGAAVGLTPTPFDSGQSDKEQGISKSGNWRVRTLMTQLTWSWLRFQPDSQLSQWYQSKFGAGTKRSRRVGIIALARKLVIALWHYVEHGVVPEGARTRALPAA